MKKLLFIFAVILFAVSVFGEDLVYIPTAVSCDGVKASFDYDTKDHNNIFNLRGGYNGYEISFVNYNNDSDSGKFIPSSKSIINGQWQILPEVGMVPAVAVGVKDLTGKISKTPAFYAVVTKDFSDYIPFELISRCALTAGISHESLGVFGGIDVRAGIFYGTCESYKKDCNFSAGISLFDDMVRFGYKRFNKSNYIGGQVGITF